MTQEGRRKYLIEYLLNEDERLSPRQIPPEQRRAFRSKKPRKPGSLYVC